LSMPCRNEREAPGHGKTVVVNLFADFGGQGEEREDPLRFRLGFLRWRRGARESRRSMFLLS
jgi:hypothetical protein